MIPIKPLTLAILAFITTALGNGLTCDGDYKQKGSSCYKLIDGVATFADADKYCKAKGGNVVSIHSREENDFIATFGVDVLIGLKYNAQKKNYSWSDGTPFDMNNWEQNYPKNPNFIGNCVQMQKSGKWINFQCEWETRYVCKKALSPHQCPVQPDNEFFVDGQVTSPGYPGNYINGLSCTYELTVKNTWNVAISVTEMELGAGDTIEIFSRLVDSNAYRIAVLSGSLTGGPQTFTTPKGENRMLVKFTSKSQNGGYWKFNFVDDHCPVGWIDVGEIGLNYCYKLTVQTMNFNDAKSVCEREGAQLVSVHNAFQNKFIYEKTLPYPSFNWLGLVYENGSWKWTDGSSVQYTNWACGEPKLSYGNCTEMWNFGTWRTMECNEERYPFCYKP